MNSRPKVFSKYSESQTITFPQGTSSQRRETSLSTKSQIAVPIPGEDNVYLIRNKETGIVKIGHAKNPIKRLKALQTGNESELKLIACCPGGLALENSYHAKFWRNKVRGEWFRLNDEELEELLSDFERRRTGVCELLTIKTVEALLSPKKKVFLDSSNQVNTKEEKFPSEITGSMKTCSTFLQVSPEEHKELSKIMPLCSYFPGGTLFTGKICCRPAVNMFTTLDTSAWRCDLEWPCRKNKGTKYTQQSGDLTALLRKINQIVGSKFKYIFANYLLWDLSLGKCLPVTTNPYPEKQIKLLSEKWMLVSLEPSKDILRLWRLGSKPLIYSIKTTRHIFECKNILSDRFLLFEDYYGVTEIWDAIENRKIFEVQGKGDLVKLISEHLLLVEDKKEVKIYNVADGRQIHSLDWEGFGIKCYYKKDDLVIFLVKTGIKFWDIKTREYFYEIVYPIPLSSTCEIIPNIGLLVIMEDEIGLWNFDSKKRLLLIKAHDEKIAYAKLINKFFLLTRSGGEVKIWDIETGKNFFEIKWEPFGIYNSYDYIQVYENRYLLGFESEEIKVFDLGQMRTIYSLSYEKDDNILFRCDEGRLISLGLNVTEIYDLATGGYVMSMDRKREYGDSFTFLGDFVCCSNHSGTEIWNIREEERTHYFNGQLR